MDTAVTAGACPPGPARAGRGGGDGGRGSGRAAGIRTGGDRRDRLRPGHHLGARRDGRRAGPGRRRAPAVYWLIALGALTGAVALTAARLGGQYQAAGQHAARVLATLAGTLVIAISFHFLLALPDGRLGQPGRRLMAGLGYASAVVTGIGLAVAGEPFPLMAGAADLAARGAVRPAGHPAALPQGGGPGQGTDAVAGGGRGGGGHRRADQRGSAICSWAGPSRPARWRPAPPWRCRWR